MGDYQSSRLRSDGGTGERESRASIPAPASAAAAAPPLDELQPASDAPHTHHATSWSVLLMPAILVFVQSRVKKTFVK